MQYDLTSALDRQRFKARVMYLWKKGAVTELTEKTFRTLNQNAYLHLLIGIVAMETGNSLADAKSCYFKELVNPDLFCVTKTDRFGNTIKTLRSSADLSKEEMSKAIDRFKRWGEENGIAMPNPGDEELLKDIAVEMGRQNLYL